jgi:hypothetical protein
LKKTSPWRRASAASWPPPGAVDAFFAAAPEASELMYEARRASSYSVS